MEEKMSLDEVHIDELLCKVVDTAHSELHLDAGKPPSIRRRGSDNVVKLVMYEDACSVDIQRMIYDILSDEQVAHLENDHSLMFSYVAQHVGKFGVFVVRDGKNMAASFLIIPHRTRDNR